MADSKHDVIMTSLMNYPDLKFSFFDFLLTKTAITSTATIKIITNIIAVVTGTPIFKPTLELSNRDPKSDADPVWNSSIKILMI